MSVGRCPAFSARRMRASPGRRSPSALCVDCRRDVRQGLVCSTQCAHHLVHAHDGVHSRRVPDPRGRRRRVRRRSGQRGRKRRLTDAALPGEGRRAGLDRRSPGDAAREAGAVRRSARRARVGRGAQWRGTGDGRGGVPRRISGRDELHLGSGRMPNSSSVDRRVAGARTRHQYGGRLGSARASDGSTAVPQGGGDLRLQSGDQFSASAEHQFCLVPRFRRRRRGTPRVDGSRDG